MVNTASCAVQLTCVQCYGGAAGGEGNFSIWVPEYDAAVGSPVGEPSNSSGVWVRNYTNGLALVNADAATNRSATLPPGAYVDLYGAAASSPVSLAPASGLVLLKGS